VNRPARHREKERRTVLVTTTSTLQGQRIVEYLGVVSSEHIAGLDVLQGGAGDQVRPENSGLQQAKHSVVAAMIAQAKALGANAVVGVDLDFEMVGHGQLIVCASGTAVIAQTAAPVPAVPPVDPDALLAQAMPPETAPVSSPKPIRAPAPGDARSP
jgi:uncharacterized protein YbjQ (UPF0145 family)